MNIGPRRLGGDCEFTVWAPPHSAVAVNLVNEKRVVPLRREAIGYWRAVFRRIALRAIGE
jgi:hypothetical protein